MTFKDWLKGISGAIALSLLCGFAHADCTTVTIDEVSVAQCTTVSEATIYTRDTVNAEIASKREDKDLVNKQIDRIDHKLDLSIATTDRLRAKKTKKIQERIELKTEIDELLIIKQYVLDENIARSM